MRHTEINSGYMVQAITNGIQKPRLLSISNSIFNNSPQRHFFHIQNTEGVNITLSDNSFTTGYPNYTGCLYLFGFNEVEIIRNTINYTTDRMFSIGINSTNNKSLNINHCNVSGFNTCIQRGYIFQDDLEDVELIYNEDIRIYNCSLNGGQNNNGAAISIGLANNYQVSGVKIDLNTISDYKTGIQINNADNFSLGITNNSITDYGLVGILVSNGSEALIKENLISADASTSEHCVGISVNQVSNPIILGNTIEAYNVSSPGSGISLVSCNNGEVRLNTIQNHLYGIELGSSSPKIGANTIINNKAYGIYISDNSNPDLTGSFVGADQFPLSGYNTIRENG
ncbi:MAG: right-handed parallel beta-helix repeat-containing protein, partial [Ignavibacteriaceae bacterium]|nr:right-handed parallel beta-helix repeat-containing protein [Ignavibacteriaceae bacterium]